MTKPHKIEPLTPELLLGAYRAGLFPMADPDHDTVFWYAPDPRAVLPLQRFHVPKTLDKTVRQGRFAVRRDAAFAEVINSCAARSETWISEEIIRSYMDLHELGYAHSVECWSDDNLVGGLYGVAIGGAFFGESMFSHERDASKVALVYLVRHLRQQGFTLLDTQYATEHLRRFGVIEIDRSEYNRQLAGAVSSDVQW